jgi:hypothetical protein
VTRLTPYSERVTKARIERANVTWSARGVGRVTFSRSSATATGPRAGAPDAGWTLRPRPAVQGLASDRRHVPETPAGAGSVLTSGAPA